MAQTYEQIKAKVLAANPTPAIVWHLHPDDPGHNFDNFSVAYASLVNVEGRIKRYEAAVEGGTGLHQWRLFGVVDTEGERDRGEVFATWLLLLAEIARRWERDNEIGRVRIATELFARDFLTEAGITDPPAPVFTSATATLAGIVPNLETLTPAFDADTLAYACTTANDAFLVFVTLGFAGQTVFWQHGHDAYVGTAQYIRLDSGENVITITVISADGQNVKTYTLTVTVTRE